MIRRSGPGSVYHEVVEHNGVLYIAGSTADDRKLDMAGQARQALAWIDEMLTKHGSSRRHVLSALVFVTDMKLKPAMNEVWKEFFGADLPTRATIGVNDLEPGILIEIVVTAAVAP